MLINARKIPEFLGDSARVGIRFAVCASALFLLSNTIYSPSPELPFRAKFRHP